MIKIAWKFCTRFASFEAVKLQHDLITLVSVMDATSGASVALQWQKGIQVLEETQEVVFRGSQNGSMEKEIMTVI